MTHLENVVRPFTALGITPPFVVLPAKTDETRVVCSLGGSGGRTVSWTFDGNGHVIPSDTNRFKESSRTSESARVENPDDSTQFVEFCRATKINLTPQKTAQSAPRVSSYDTSGGYQNFTNTPNTKGADDRQYSFRYPKGGCGDSGAPPKGCA